MQDGNIQETKPSGRGARSNPTTHLLSLGVPFLIDVDCLGRVNAVVQ